MRGAVLVALVVRGALPGAPDVLPGSRLAADARPTTFSLRTSPDSPRAPPVAQRSVKSSTPVTSLARGGALFMSSQVAVACPLIITQ
jgi:hypothetical protein